MPNLSRLDNWPEGDLIDGWNLRLEPHPVVPVPVDWFEAVGRSASARPGPLALGVHDGLAAAVGACALVPVLGEGRGRRAHRHADANGADHAPGGTTRYCRSRQLPNPVL